MKRRLIILLALLTGIGVGVGYAATLTVSSFHLFAGTQTLTKGTCTLTGTAQTTDTFVDQNNANHNSGTTATMSVKPDSGKQQWTFVNFDLSSCAIPTTGGADTATVSLRIQTAPSASRTLTVTPVAATWADTLTWNQAQSLTYGSTTTTFSTGSSNNVTVSFPVTIDVDALIKGSTTNFGWRISDGGSQSGSDTTTFASSNGGSNRPQLVINYEK